MWAAGGASRRRAAGSLSSGHVRSRIADGHWARDCALSAGMTVEVDIAPEGAQRIDLVPDAAAALDANPIAATFFDARAVLYQGLPELD